MTDSTRQVFGSMRVGERTQKNVWLNNMVKTVVEGKQAAQKGVLGDTGEITEERYMEVYKKEKRKVKRCIYQIKQEVNESLEGR